MRENDRVVIKFGPARYDSDKAVRDKINDAIDNATNDAYNSIVNNPNLDLAGGGVAPTPTPGQFPIYSAPSLATNYPVDGLALSSVIYSETGATAGGHPGYAAIDIAGGAGLGANTIFGQTWDAGSSNQNNEDYRSFNVDTGVSTVLTTHSSGSSNETRFAWGDFLYTGGARWSLATGWQYLRSDDTYGTTSLRSNLANYEIIGTSNGYLWITYPNINFASNQSGASFGIWAVDTLGSVTKAFSLAANTSMIGGKVENGTIWFTTISSSGTRVVRNAPATPPLVTTTVATTIRPDHNSHYQNGIDTSGNRYFLDTFNGAFRLNVQDLSGNVTQYPYVFSTTGDPYDGEPTTGWDEDILSYRYGYHSISVIYGRIFVGTGVAGDYISANNSEWAYPAIYEIALSPSGSTSSLFHVGSEFTAAYGTGTYRGNYAISQGPVLLPGGDISWCDTVFNYRTVSSSPAYSSITYDIYRATI